MQAILFFVGYRQRLQELEIEGERLDQSFQTYLQRQAQEKRKLDHNVTKIWENYNIDRQFLSQTEFTTTPKTTVDNMNQRAVQCIAVENEPLAVSHNELRDLDTDDRSSMSPTKHFQNPFRQITIDEIRLSKPSRIDTTRMDRVASKAFFKPKSDTVLNRHVKIATTHSQSARPTPAPVTVVQQHHRNAKMDQITSEVTADSYFATMPQVLLKDAIESTAAPSSVSIHTSPPLLQEGNMIMNDAERRSEDVKSMPVMFSDNKPEEGSIDGNGDELNEFKDIVHEVKASESGLTYTVGRNHSNDFIADDDDDIGNNNYRSDGDQDVMSIGIKDDDLSDDFWK